VKPSKHQLNTSYSIRSGSEVPFYLDSTGRLFYFNSHAQSKPECQFQVVLKFKLDKFQAEDTADVNVKVKYPPVAPTVKNLTASSQSSITFDLRSSVRQQIEQSKRVLLEQWFDECTDDERLDLMGDFFEAAMAALIHTLIHTTLDDLIDFLTLYLNGNYYVAAQAARPFHSIYVPHAIVPLLVSLKPDLHTSSAHLEPSIAHVNSSLRHLVDQIVHSLSELPQLETLLFQNFKSTRAYMNMLKSDEESVRAFKSRIDAVTLANKFGPAEYLKTYGQFEYLLSNACVKETNVFMLRKKNTLVDFGQKIEHLKALMADVRRLTDTVALNLYVLDCSELNACLLRRAQSCIDIMVGKVLADNMHMNKLICVRFERIVHTMTQYGETPDECVKLIKYVESVRFYEAFQLKAQVGESAENVLFPLDYFPPRAESVPARRMCKSGKVLYESTKACRMNCRALL
jgi:hypothetical protein